MKKILFVAGVRAIFMKMFPLMEEMSKSPNFSLHLVHTGQNYDKDMAQPFFDDLDIPKPDISLEGRSGSHA